MNHISEEQRVEFIILNTITEGPSVLNQTGYDYVREAIDWATEDILFADKSRDDILAIFRKYETWNAFEAECEKLKES